MNTKVTIIDVNRRAKEYAAQQQRCEEALLAASKEFTKLHAMKEPESDDRRVF